MKDKVAHKWGDGQRYWQTERQTARKTDNRIGCVKGVRTRRNILNIIDYTQRLHSHKNAVNCLLKMHWISHTNKYT